MEEPKWLTVDAGAWSLGTEAAPGQFRPFGGSPVVSGESQAEVLDLLTPVTGHEEEPGEAFPVA